jgi:large subunit ribosomal protein L10
MARPEKEASVSEMQAKFEVAGSVVVADYRGLNVTEVTQLRKQLREAGVELKVAKNTLTLIAAKNVGIEGLDSILKGPSAMAFGVKDLVAPAKILTSFAKDHKMLEVKGGVVQGKVVDIEGVKALADLPPKEVLVARALGGMKAPLCSRIFPFY